MANSSTTQPPPANDELDLHWIKGNRITILTLAVGVLLGIVVCYFFLSTQPWWTNSLISNAVQATVAAQLPRSPLPTLTPWPTPTPWPTYTPVPAVVVAASPAAPTPPPGAHIVKPDFADGPVAMQANAIVRYDNIPSDRFLWVVVNVPHVSPRLLVYPQLLKGIPAPVVGSSTLDLPVQFGGNQPADSGAAFNLVVLLLDADAHQRFLQYSQTCIADPTNPKNCGGLQLPETGVQILDFSTVIRK